MSLVRWRNPYEIRVELPGVQECEVEAECYRPVRAVVFFMPDLARLENRLVCYRHAEQAKAIGRCLIFPHDLAPHPDVVLQRVNQELQRRQQQQQRMYQPTGSYGFFNGGTTTSGFTIRFG